MSIQNRLVWQMTYKFVFISFISSTAIFVNVQKSSAIPVKRVLNNIGHNLVDQLLGDKSSSQDREYNQESTNQQTTDANNTYPNNDQTYNSGNSTEYSAPPSSPNEQQQPPTNQQQAPTYQQPAPTSSPNTQRQKPHSNNSVIINNF